ncbi:MAG: hemolysin family protein [Hyphomicrobiaceae bacterium]
MFELLIVLLLILLNGLFALSELAVVSARLSRLKAMEAAGRRGARRAQVLALSPGRFLSAVQIGITLIGIVNGAYSGEAFGDRTASWLEGLGAGPRVAEPLGYGLVIVVITYLSVIVGELVPKSLALKNAEGIACTVAPAMTAFAKAAAPVVWLLDSSTRLVFRLLGQSSESEQRVTDEEIKMLIKEAETSGVIEAGEREMIAGVMRLADRSVAGLMTPRIDVDWLDVTEPPSETRKRLLESTHTRLPVVEGTPDVVIGVATSRELMVELLAGRPLDLRAHLHKAPVVPPSVDALKVLATLREAEVPMLLIHDEYGHFEGIVTPADVLEAIAGGFRSDQMGEEPDAVERADGSWLIAGSMPIDEMAEHIGFALAGPRDYETVAGLLLAELQHIPEIGDRIELRGWRFEVVDMDGRRIDRVLASRVVPLRRHSI